MWKNDANSGINYNGLNWAYHVKILLESLVFYEIWMHQDIGSIGYMLIKQRIYDQNFQSWYANVNNSQRLIIYCMFKHDFIFENYLDCIADHKVALCKLRVSSHELEIENKNELENENKSRNERLCHRNLIENEYHFLLICTLYSELRKKYLKTYYYTWPNLHKFSKNIKELLNLSKYIYFASLEQKLRIER